MDGLSTTKPMTLWWWKNTKDNQKIEAFMVNYQSLTPKRYSYSEFKKMTDSFNGKFGQGGCGGVYKGKLPVDSLVAVKSSK
jgi:putative salt-induced outer membrane protein YdiY